MKALRLCRVAAIICMCQPLSVARATSVESISLKLTHAGQDLRGRGHVLDAEVTNGTARTVYVSTQPVIVGKGDPPTLPYDQRRSSNSLWVGTGRVDTRNVGEVKWLGRADFTAPLAVPIRPRSFVRLRLLVQLPDALVTRNGGRWAVLRLAGYNSEPIGCKACPRELTAEAFISVVEYGSAEYRAMPPGVAPRADFDIRSAPLRMK